MEFGRGLKVPLQADSVLSPEVRYDVFASNGRPMTSIVFPLEDEYETGFLGRVTFEGLDSIRCSRGEYAPYEVERGPEFPWVFEIENSSWLQQRHEYEASHYQTPLLEEYVHYLFSFHDEFVESIARGIWFEKVRRENIYAEPSADHPLRDLSESLHSEDFTVEGIHCSVRHNPLTLDELIDQSKLCSQALVQYFITLDGQTKPSFAAQVRTIRGKTMTRLRGGLFHKDLATVERTGQEREFRKAFSRWVAEVAERRRQMGKHD